MDGKSVVCVITKTTIGPLTVRENSPKGELSCVRPDFEIWTDGLSYNAGSMASVPFISARVILDPPKGPHSPHRAAVRVLNPVQRAGLENKIKIWLEQDIIEESASPWSWPMISVAKKRRAGQTIPEYRFCADLRVLNNKVLTDNWFTGSVPANLALLERHNIYSNLDM